MNVFFISGNIHQCKHTFSLAFSNKKTDDVSKIIFIFSQLFLSRFFIVRR